jgi:hypothetical protein
MTPGTRLIWRPTTNTQRSAKARFLGTPWVFIRLSPSRPAALIAPEGHPEESRWVSITSIEPEQA